MTRPDSTEYAPFYHGYVSLVPEEDILPVLDAQLTEMLAFLHGVTEAQGGQRHPPYTWSIKEVVGHLADTEQILGYRALRIARADQTPLPGFDENDYARTAEFDRVPLRDLVSRFEAVRRSHLFLFRSLPGEAWMRTGEANGNLVSVRALAYIIVGHTRHHTAILRQRLSRKDAT
jgi:hypothetical protein